MRTNVGLYSEDNKPKKPPVPLKMISSAEENSVTIKKLPKGRPSVGEMTNHTGRIIPEF